MDATAAVSITPSLVALEGEPGGAISIDLEVGASETIANPGECRVRALLYEDSVSAGETFHHVVRAIPIDVALPISGPGQTARISDEVLFDPSWKPEDLFIVAWVQRDPTMEVLNAAASPISDPTPAEKASWGSMKAGYR